MDLGYHIASLTVNTPRGYTANMPDKKLQNRLHRVEGQLRKLQESIAADKDCTEVIPQFLAVKGAIAAAFELYVTDSLDSCATSDEKKMKKLIGLLIKK